MYKIRYEGDDDHIYIEDCNNGDAYIYISLSLFENVDKRLKVAEIICNLLNSLHDFPPCDTRNNPSLD